MALAVSASACSPREAGEAQSAAAPAQTIEQNPDLLPIALRDGALADATPDRIRAMIEEHGALPVVHSLYGERQDAGWFRVEERVASGDQAWLDLVPLLRAADTAAAPSEGLAIAVSDALPNNAPGVLRLIEGRHRADLVCSFRRVEPESAEITAYYAAAIPAVRAVADPTVQSVKQQCLTALERNRAEDLANAQ